ncbi:MAG: hypothetical protein NPIRA01_21100 [Nitrospirales bacterium]|nr:MAG: hypothetical protein NPIRA01_21100 [Nitrospirales bacterium]
MDLVLGGKKDFFALSEDGVDGLSRTGIKAESAGFQAARRIEFKRGSGKPCAGWAYGNTDGIMGTTVWVTNEMISSYHHGSDSFK